MELASCILPSVHKFITIHSAIYIWSPRHFKSWTVSENVFPNNETLGKKPYVCTVNVQYFTVCFLTSLNSSSKIILPTSSVSKIFLSRQRLAWKDFINAVCFLQAPKSSCNFIVHYRLLSIYMYINRINPYKKYHWDLFFRRFGQF